MSTKRRSNPLQAMHEATAALTRAGVNFQQPTAFHLKVKGFNFWPSSGKMSRDGDPTQRNEHGLSDFISLLHRAGHAKALCVQAIDSPANAIENTTPSESYFARY